MHQWDDYKLASRNRGLLGLELYAIESTPLVPREEWRRWQADHMAYQEDLERKGVLAFAGPLSDDTGEVVDGVTLSIYRAASMEDARRLAVEDPFHANGGKSWRLRRWLVNGGHVTVSVGLLSKLARVE
ncbi:YciI family protein [Frigidibacter mobilis]|uniref:YCII-like protein n=1 Tax=Frigidibacter mobilis TaxID=1335048 RepID=A0A159Z6S2_9RHOB|nr:YciI family protein [Frigidibacter mobilis]AMY71051.1 YCII-like protein [Frigidibacter mobilis]